LNILVVFFCVSVSHSFELKRVGSSVRMIFRNIHLYDARVQVNH
jgi:hypothetical protein